MTKPVNLTVFCKKSNCKFEIDWEECPSKLHALDYYWIYNKLHSKEMECIHDYDVTLKEAGK